MGLVGVSLDTGPAVKNELSRHLAPAYTLPSLLQSEPAISSTLALLFNWLDKFAASSEPVHLDKYFTFATSDIVGEAIFSKPIGFLREGRDIDNTIANSHPQAAYVSVAGSFRWIHNPDGRMQMYEVHSAAFNAVAAGNETISAGMQAFRARAEMGAADLGNNAAGVVSFADAQRLPFLQACIKEALRMFGRASMGLGEDASEFNPDPWFAADAASREKYFIPCGKGYASCSGQNLAKFELSKVCATLVRGYDIRQVEPQQEWTWKAYFTGVPENWPCYVAKREKA
ncbi:cytochrome P450 [Achaetomium macrosporum]|uniref:Cytochrome P450 n=1 Tax=Achaetomium macrosporum TaxID=79813 RepID=A0AAN7HBQ1_9PEZI|nr:cytochrome P450 [Achaetomium macrosporum]